ncbi:Uncharacterized protein YR821_2901 [Yersinia ruckeri]|uniref:Uncharacterized protein n=1 Tax=Yersinia ruckeri TaxID=29486 RepID=A0A0A8VME0_YERRU|nr:Uncharacterized protein YR821_2901 [Yersinia ruckeri]CEK28741.1 hypothetical protein CSF007_15090 [Yersinia ruckeri]
MGEASSLRLKTRYRGDNGRWFSLNIGITPVPDRCFKNLLLTGNPINFIDG